MEKNFFHHKIEGEPAYSRNHYIADILRWNLKVPQAGYAMAMAGLHGFLQYKISNSLDITTADELSVSNTDVATIIEYMERAHSHHGVRVLSEDHSTKETMEKKFRHITHNDISGLYGYLNTNIDEIYKTLSKNLSDETILEISKYFIDFLSTQHELLHKRKAILKDFMKIKNNRLDASIEIPIESREVSNEDIHYEEERIKANLELRKIDSNLIQGGLANAAAHIDVHKNIQRDIEIFLDSMGLTNLS